MVKPIKVRIHYNKFEKKWTHKTSRGCPRHSSIIVDGLWYTEVNEKLKTNPKGFVVTTSDNTAFVTDAEALKVIENHPTNRKLLYDKVNMKFNYSSGTLIVFCPKGAFVLK